MSDIFVTMEQVVAFGIDAIRDAYAEPDATILAAADALAAADRTDPAARSGRWVARDALRELRSDKVVERVRRRG